MKNLILLISTLFLFSCGAIYGNKKITDEVVKKINEGSDVKDVKALIGAPYEIKQNFKNEKIYEYEYHKIALSPIYYIPIASAIYYAFGQSPFSPARTVKVNTDHNYLFLQFDKNDKLIKKDFYKTSNTINPFQSSCAAPGYSVGCNVPLEVSFTY